MRDHGEDHSRPGPGAQVTCPSDVLRRQASDIVEGWVADLPPGAPARSVELVEAYHAVGQALVEAVALRIQESEGQGGHSPGGEPRWNSRVLGRVAAESRRLGRATWQTLDDLNRLLPRLLEPLRGKLSGGGFGHGVIACGVVVDATAATARVLEATALRFDVERSRTQASMADMLVHELRNRLAAAETASRMLLAAEAPVDHEWLARVADLIRSSVDAGLRTVDDVRDLAAIRDRPGRPRPRPVPLPLLLRDVIRELEPQAGEVGVRMLVDEEIPGVLVDASRFRLILVNLIGNAIKYRDRNRDNPLVEVGVADAPDLPGLYGEGLRGGDSSEGPALRLYVRDNGIGIAPEEVEEIFLLRYRGDHALELDGSGLGLAIASEAAEQLGATIDVQSLPGVGTTFGLTFRPLRDPAAQPTP